MDYCTELDKIFEKHSNNKNNAHTLYICKLCNGRMYDDQYNGTRVCECCGYCVFVCSDFGYIDYNLRYNHAISYDKRKYYKPVDKFLVHVKDKISDKNVIRMLNKMFRDSHHDIRRIYHENGRKNLNYNFIARKFLFILKLHELAELFPKNRSRSNNKKLERVWANVCDEMKW